MTMMLLILLTFIIILLTARGVPTPVVTIKSPDGDIIDCFWMKDQPAFEHPLLHDHDIQEFPSGTLKLETDVAGIRQVWHETGTCPAGTVPIRRDVTDVSNVSNVSHTKYHPEAYNGNNVTFLHQYAVAYKQNLQKIYGTRATLNVWDPVVEADNDFSLAQVWIATGSYENADVNTVEAGWQVFPMKYHDHQPRLFAFWTRDAYNRTGCYSLDCPGFAQTSNTIALEGAISRVSTSGGPQLDITLQIWKDPFSGNCWLALGHNIMPVGYWPSVLFTGLSDHATTVHWGGEVLYQNTSGVNTKNQMGSGEFAEKGFGRAAYFCDLRLAEDNHKFLPVQDFFVRATNPRHYTIKKSENRACGTHFFFGGPGPQRSEGVRETLDFFLFMLCFLLVLSI